MATRRQPNAAPKGFAGKPGRPSMKARGWDGTARDKQRIQDLRVPKDGTWAMSPAAAACDRELGQVTPLHVLTLLCKYRNAETGECFPSIGRLARDLGLADRRSIQRHIDKLVERGYVVVLPRRTGDGRTNTSNAYVVLYPPLALPENPGQDDDGGGEGGLPADQTQKTPGGPAIAKNGGVTPSAAGGVAHAATGVPPQADASGALAGGTPWHMMPTPVAHDADPRGGMCRTNHPTRTIPSINDPSAEAARARAAAAQDGDGDIGKGTAETLTADAPPEARQEVPRIKARDMRPPPPPQDLVGAVVRWISKMSGIHEGHVWASALQWHETLKAGGFTDLEAQQAIASEGKLLEAFDQRTDLVSKMDIEIGELVARKQTAAA